MMLSPTEENYLKTILQLSAGHEESVSTNAIAEQLQTAAASVTDMLKRLGDKGLADYEKYKGARLSDEGRRIATQLIRKHRLWETFMVDKLGFSWDEVHPIAEELEHIHSEELIERLDTFLGHPKFDPHGDPIPDRHGNITPMVQVPLIELPLNQMATVVGVREHGQTFLRYLEQLSLTLGAKLQVIDREDYDGSLRLEVEGKTQLVTYKVAQNLLMQPENVD